jgi:hypothetical protein
MFSTVERISDLSYNFDDGAAAAASAANRALEGLVLHDCLAARNIE